MKFFGLLPLDEFMKRVGCVFTGLTVNENTVLNPKVREFWEKISGLIIPQTEGGCLDIFLPLAASGESEC